VKRIASRFTRESCAKFWRHLAQIGSSGFDGLHVDRFLTVSWLSTKTSLLVGQERRWLQVTRLVDSESSNPETRRSASLVARVCPILAS
jgi:hypothetical protein